MEADKLVSMANQIASFFQSYPEAEAVKGIADHLVLFWTPRMRGLLTDRLDVDAAGVSPLVRLAVAVQDGRAHVHAESPIKKTATGPAAQGQLASDAG